MKFKQVIIVLSILMLISIVIFIRYNSYGIAYNNVRMNLEITPVDRNWIKKISYSQHEINYNNPLFLLNGQIKKRILLTEFGSIRSEADLFIIKTNHITIDAVYTYNRTNPWVITYFNTVENLKKTISRKQLTDTLKKYKIM